MFQFLLTIMVLILGMFSGYMYNEVKFLKIDLENVQQKVAQNEASKSAERVVSQAEEFLMEFGQDNLVKTENVEPKPTEKIKETIEISEGFLKGFLDVDSFEVLQDSMSIGLEFNLESPTLEKLVLGGTGGVYKVSENKYKIALGCINNAGLVKSQVFSLSVDETKTLLGSKASSLRLFFSPKVGFLAKDCQSPLSLLQVNE